MTNEQLLIEFREFLTREPDRRDQAMIEKHLLVDFENVQRVELSWLDESFRVTIFVGASQKSIPVELVAEAQKLGDRVDWIRLESNGKNALDFLIACELGRMAERKSKLECLVLSRDKGFDPLMRHLSENGLNCRRISSISEFDPNFCRVIEILGKVEKKTRSSRRESLTKAVRSMFPSKIKKTEVERIVEALFENGLVTEANNSLSYEF